MEYEYDSETHQRHLRGIKESEREEQEQREAWIDRRAPRTHPMTGKPELPGRKPKPPERHPMPALLGRRPLAPELKRWRSVTIPINDHEAAVLQATVAMDEGRTFTSWCRSVLLAYAKSRGVE